MSKLTEAEWDDVRSTVCGCLSDDDLRATVTELIERREQEAWRVAAMRRSEARRYYVAWQIARMRALDYRTRLMGGGDRA